MSNDSDNLTVTARARAPLACILFLLIAAASACQVGPKVLQLKKLPTPSGGMVLTLVEVKPPDGEPVTIAPTSRGIFALRDARWSLHEPSSSSQETSELTAALRSPNLDTARFVSFDGLLWWLDITDLGGAPRLSTSKDQGHTWHPIALPAPYDNRRHTRLTARTNFRSGGASAEANLSLAVRDGALFLLDASNVWRVSVQGEKRTWDTISLQGVPLGAQSARDGFPSLLRSYMPATPARPFELVTVLSDQLMVYRRDESAEAFILTATLPTVDRAIDSDASGDVLILLTPDSLYFSNAQAEEWEKVRLVQPSILGEECERMTLVRDIGAAAGASEERDKEAILIGTSTGRLLRGSLDNYSNWVTVRESDSDGRGISEILQTTTGDLLASTLGQGTLISSDGGMTWTPRNEDLTATRLFDLSFTPSGQALLGTDGGLFGAIRVEQDSREELTWRELDARSATTIAPWEPISIGTAGGAIVTPKKSDGVDTQSGMGQRQAPLFLPFDRHGPELPPHAILSLQERDDSQLRVAFSHQRGSMLSQDGGTSWLQEPHNEFLEGALDGARVSAWVLAPNNTRYLLSSPLRPDLRPQLWRTDDDGITWRSVYTFSSRTASPRMQMAHIQGSSAEDLLLTTSEEILRSKDGGRSWSTIVGPWQGKQILAFTLEKARAAVLVQDQSMLEAIDIQDINAPELEIARYQLRPEKGVVLGSVLEVHIRPRAIYLRTQSQVWIASARDRGTELTYNLTLLLSVVLALALGSITFLIARRFG